MANVINLPTYEQTEEIRQNVEDIGSLVNDTSGVFVGTDGKKYKGNFETRMVEKRITHNDNLGIAHMYADNDYLYTFTGNYLNAFDKTTFQHMAYIGSGAPYSSNHSIGFAYDDDFLYYRNNTAGNRIHIVNKNDWTFTQLDFPTVIVALFLYDGVLHTIGNTGIVYKRIGNEMVQQYQVGVGATTIQIASLVAMHCDGEYCYIHTQQTTGNMTNGNYIKFDPSNGNIVVNRAVSFHQNAKILGLDSENIAITESSSTAILNKDTLTAIGHIRGVQSFGYDTSLEKFVVGYGADMFFVDENNTATLYFNAVSPISITPLGNGKVAMFYGGSNRVIVVYEQTNQLVGYEEVI